MRYLSIFLVISLLACSDNDPKKAKEEVEFDHQVIETIYFPCGKYNGSADWLECTAVTIDISDKKLVEARMTYSMFTTRGSSKMFAELYDITNQRSVLFSEVEANTDVSIFSKPKSEDILDYLPKGSANLVIRFRNSVDGPEGYINDYSYLTLVFE